MADEASSDDGREEDRLSWLETAAAVGGALGGTALTLKAGPFAGSAGGELIAQTLLAAGQAIQKRLEPRRQKRLGAAFESATAASAEYLRAGREPRQDGLFEARDRDGEIPVEEIAEGIFQTAADQWENRKVPYIGRLLANIAFDDSVSPDEASYLIRLSDRLSYRQYCLLALWDRATEPGSVYRSALERISAEGNKFDDVIGTSGLLAEMNQLGQGGLLGTLTTEGVVVNLGVTWAGAGGSFRDLAPNEVHLTRDGERFQRLLDLQLVPAEDLDELVVTVREATK